MTEQAPEQGTPQDEPQQAPDPGQVIDFGPDASDGYEVVTDPLDGAKTFDVDKPVNIEQLQHEIATAAGVEPDDVVVAMTTENTDPITADNKATLWVTPDSLDGRTVRGCITAHTPDMQYGWSDDRKAQAAVVAKVRAGEALTPEELSIALQALLASSTAR